VLVGLLTAATAGLQALPPLYLAAKHRPKLAPKAIPGLVFGALLILSGP